MPVWVYSLCLLFFLTSCAGFLGISPKEAPFSKTLRHEIFLALQGRETIIKTVQGDATARYGSKIFGARGDMAVLVKPPYQLRIDTLSEFGMYDAQLLLSNGELMIYWPDKNHYLQELATDDLMARYLAVSLDADATIAFLSGFVPLHEESRYTLREDPKKNEIVMVDDSSQLAVTRREDTYVPVRYTAYDPSGSRLYTVEFSDYRKDETFWMTHQIKGQFKNPSSHIELQWGEVKVNAPMDKKSFEIQIPDDAYRVED